MRVCLLIVFLNSLSQARLIFQSLRDAPSDHRKYWELYSMEDDGSDVKRITHNLYWESQPDVSPDGKRIVFAIHYHPDSLASETDSGFEIAVMDIDGKNLKRLTNNNYLDCCPHWNHNGTRIVYVSGKHKEDGALISLDIYMMNPDGDSVKKLTDAKIGEFYADPSFSFKEDKILYVYCWQGDTGWDIYMMNGDGSGKHLILSTDDTHLAYHDPMFSPNDSGMVFEAMLNRDGNHGIPVYKIFTARVDSSNIRQITDNDDETDVYPQYSPDGGRILYFTWKWKGVFERRIRIIDTAGIDERVLSTFSPEIYPSWYPELAGIIEKRDALHLLQGYPNPFTQRIELRYKAPIGGHTLLEIYNISGQRVERLVDEFESAGVHRVWWESRAGGVYFCRLRVRDKSLNFKKIVILK